MIIKRRNRITYEISYFLLTMLYRLDDFRALFKLSCMKNDLLVLLRLDRLVLET